MNIVGMGLPAYAYVDPTYYGGAAGADLWAWGIAFAVVDGKMRALFTMLFGASMAIMADAAEATQRSPTAIHYRRMGWLLLFGMIHAWLIWYGDILVEYAVVGAILFVARGWRNGAVLTAALVLLGLAALFDLTTWLGMAHAQTAAAAPGASVAARDAWEMTLAAFRPDPAGIAEDIALYRGGFAQVFAARAEMTLFMQTIVLPASLFETLGFAALGLWLLRTGVLTGARDPRLYRALAAVGLLVALPLGALLALDTIGSGFDVVRMQRNDLLSFLLRPWLALAYASLVILWLRSGRAVGLAMRLTAAGRVALTNYLATSLLCTTLFYGYGFGLYAHLGRAGLYGIVVGVWLLLLAWSAPWLSRFRYGPAEWLWRSLTRGRIEELRVIRKPIAT